MSDLRGHLQATFGLDDFRPAQREVIEDVLAGRDVLCVMPTGAGKSLCYQFPATYGGGQGGLTLVVSPLISLMQDQVQQLRDEDIPASLLNSSLSAAMQRQVMEELAAGFEGLLYVAPERLFQPSFQSLLGRLKVRMLAVDEAHCISQWGHDFRPEYARLGEVRRSLGEPTTIALTATATEDVRSDIIEQLGLRDPRVYVTGFDRPNLRYACRTIARAKEKMAELVSMLRKEPGSGIVYCATRKSVDEVAGALGEALPGRTVVAYHAGMEPGPRTEAQERFMETAGAVAVATNAFGMGINKPDLRFVVHWQVPGTLEAYYQEAGRAGRDGLPSRCVLLLSYQDRYIQESFINRIGEEEEGSGLRVQGSGQTSSGLNPEPRTLNPSAEPRTLNPDRIAALQEHAREKLNFMMLYAQAHQCRRRMILKYFGDESEIDGCDCDVCRRERGEADDDFGAGHALPTMAVTEEVTLLVRKLLSGVARVCMRGQFGAGMIADVLTGAENDKVLRWRFQELSVFGLLRVYPARRVVAMLHRLMEAGLARQRDPEGMKFRPVMELTTAGVEVMKGARPVPPMLADLLGGTGRGPSSSRPVSVKRVATVAESQDFDEPARQRFERLRAVRADLARQRQLPAYCICHDATLRSIALAAPATPEDLEMIKGMGPNKVRLYGEALLGAIRTPSPTSNQ